MTTLSQKILKAEIILASASVIRGKILQNAGVIFDIQPAAIDEEPYKTMKYPPPVIAQTLADQKALFISEKNREAYSIGADQILVLDTQIISKAKNRAEAFERLTDLQGTTHDLISAVSVAKNNEVVFRHMDSASLTMKPMGAVQIDSYLDQAGAAVKGSVGCYALEGVGVRLFSKIQGDYFTILGLPFLPLLNYLEEEGLISWRSQ